MHCLDQSTSRKSAYQTPHCFLHRARIRGLWGPLPRHVRCAPSHISARLLFTCWLKANITAQVLLIRIVAHGFWPYQPTFRIFSRSTSTRQKVSSSSRNSTLCEPSQTANVPNCILRSANGGQAVCSRWAPRPVEKKIVVSPRNSTRLHGTPKLLPKKTSIREDSSTAITSGQRAISWMQRR